MTADDGALRVEQVTRSVPNEHLRGDIQIDQVTGGRLELMGWAIGRRSPVMSIEILSKGAVVATTPTGVSRPDLAEAFPDESTAATAGYRIAIEAEGHGRSALELRALLADGSYPLLGQVVVEVPRQRERLLD